MKVAIITDQHFGFKKGSKLYHDYFLKFYEEVFFPTLEREQITTVIDMGDTFDSRKNVDFYSLDWAKKHYFDRIRDNRLHLFSVVGNHTAFYKNTNEINTIDLLLREYDNITVISDAQELKVGDLKVLFIPWINSDNEAETYKKINATTAKVAMGHLELNGFAAHHGFVMEDGDDSEPYQKFDRVFSGHYHTRSNNGKIFYLGNPYQMFWNDVYDKRGFHIFDTETYELTPINNPFNLYEIVNYDDTPKQLVNFKQYEGKIIKLVVKNKSSKKEYEKFIDALMKANPADLKIVEKINTVQLDEEFLEQTEDTMTLLNKYVEELETNLNKAKMKNLIKDIYQQACEVM
jgi:DNA repair exonuclease SbcCD nuclease subunit